jgi:hypothetical protein
VDVAVTGMAIASAVGLLAEAHPRHVAN